MSPGETQAWAEAWLAADYAVRHAQLAIQHLATQTEGDADMKLCFAGGALHGVQALLREADQIHRQLVLPLPEAPPARTTAPPARTIDYGRKCSACGGTGRRYGDGDGPCFECGGMGHPSVPASEVLP